MDVKVSNFPAFPASPYDVSDRAARLLGIVYGNLDELQQKAVSKQLLVWVDNFPAFPATYDVSDRAARLLGIIYGNLGQLDQISLGGRNLVTVELQGWLGSQAPTVGQKAMAASLPVVIASDQGNVPVAEAPPTSIGVIADVTAAAGATQLIAASTPCKCVLVTSLAANTGLIRVGDANVTASKGGELTPGNSIPIEISNVNKVYVFGNGTDKVSIVYVN
jgi:hypothetical protein